MEQDAALAIEQVIVGGNLAQLSPAQRLKYYKLLCEALKLNYLTRPFEYVTINGKLLLYARRDATDQLRRIHGVAIDIVARERYEDAYVVTARARMPDGRTDEAVGAVSLKGLQGLEFANALMKAETKAKRRVTLSIVGLGWSDETEIETIAGALVGGKPIKQIAPARKFADLTDAEKRAALQAGWEKRAKDLQERGVGSIPQPDFQAGALEGLMQAAGLLGEALKEEDTEKISGILQRVQDILTSSAEAQKETTNGDNQSDAEAGAGDVQAEDHEPG